MNRAIDHAEADRSALRDASRHRGAFSSFLATEQVSMTDIARMIGVKPQTVRVYRKGGELPDPDGFIGRTPWWWRSRIAAWQAARPRASGRG